MLASANYPSCEMNQSLSETHKNFTGSMHYLIFGATYPLHPPALTLARLLNHYPCYYHLLRFPRFCPPRHLALRCPCLRRCRFHPHPNTRQWPRARVIASRSVHGLCVVVRRCGVRTLRLSVRCRMLLLAHSHLRPSRAATGR
ncbi:hypothetical protein FIBSPDRAFT_55596 [Athelia psychrophila]|uniref:Uncharacterized protein n=1 Tax=Athelia psychrophila TaxID=1759441 RepID=A0A166FF82_9AGAM|nr:hypothetical protein FIBSPDRAFT_55596 [Fibularhizoctonia sp. CBS 109695]